VPNVTNINSNVLTADVPAAGVLPAGVLSADVLTSEHWRARLGAFTTPRCGGFLGTGVSSAGGGTGPSVVVRPVPRVRDMVVQAFPAPQPAFAAKLAQLNNYNHMTSVYAVGEGASGPPPDREPA
jgi:hypothetical protein